MKRLNLNVVFIFIFFGLTGFYWLDQVYMSNNLPNRCVTIWQTVGSEQWKVALLVSLFAIPLLYKFGRAKEFIQMKFEKQNPIAVSILAGILYLLAFIGIYAGLWGWLNIFTVSLSLSPEDSCSIIKHLGFLSKPVLITLLVYVITRYKLRKRIK